jgi:ubiquitin-associated and SH3 domain-containing protein
MEQVRWNKSTSKRVVIFRHGERVDITFGFPFSWTEVCFDEDGNYKKTNLNLPDYLPERSFEDWRTDGPLTKIGGFQSQLVGSELKNNDVKFTKVFVSPAYRCLETAQGILNAMNVDLPMKVEYGLYEWLGYCKRFKIGFPKFLAIDKMKKIFNVDMNYKPILTCDQLEKNLDETLEDLYNRNSSVMKEIFNNSEGDILVVAHGISIDSCTRQLLQKEPRCYEEMKSLLQDIPFLASTALEKIDGSNYKFIDPPCYPLTSKSCPKFNWKTLVG